MLERYYGETTDDNYSLLGGRIFIHEVLKFLSWFLVIFLGELVLMVWRHGGITKLSIQRGFRRSTFTR
jgi:hypothetical protein